MAVRERRRGLDVQPPQPWPPELPGVWARVVGGHGDGGDGAARPRGALAGAVARRREAVAALARLLLAAVRAGAAFVAPLNGATLARRCWSPLDLDAVPGRRPPRV